MNVSFLVRRGGLILNNVEQENSEDSKWEVFLLLIIPCAILILSPTIFWTGKHGDSSFSAGGDYINILFLNPQMFIQHVSLKVLHSISGFESLTPYISIALVSVVIKSIGLNAQLLLVGFSLAGLFSGMYFLVQEFEFEVSRLQLRVAGFLTAVISTLSPLVSQNLFVSFSPAIWLLPFVPWMIVFFIRFCAAGEFKSIWLSAILCFFCAAGITDVPDSIPCLTLMMMVALVILRNRRILNLDVLKKSLFLFLSTLFLNALWLVPWIDSMMKGNTLTSLVNLNAAVTSSAQLVSSLSHYSDIFDSLLLRNSNVLMSAFQWPQLEYTHWFQVFSVFGMVPLLVITSAMYFSAFNKNNLTVVTSAFYQFLFIFVVFLILQSLGVVPFSAKIFSWLVVNIPLLTSLRNFYKVFAIPYVLVASICSGISILVLSKFLKKRQFVVLSLIAAISFSFYGLPLLSGESYRLPISAGDSSNRLISKLPIGYTNISSYIYSHGSGATLSLPLLNSSSAWTLINDVSPKGNFYLGVSPMKYLYGIENYVSTASFSIPGRTESVQNLNELRKVPFLTKKLNGLGIKFVVLNSSLISDKSFRAFSLFNSEPTEKIFYRDLLTGLRAKFVLQKGDFQLYILENSRTSGSTNFSGRHSLEISKANLCSLGISVTTLLMLLSIYFVRKNRSTDD